MSIPAFARLMGLVGGYYLADQHMKDELKDQEHSEEDLRAMKKAEEEQRIKSSYSRSHMDKVIKDEAIYNQSVNKKIKELEDSIKKMQDKIKVLKNEE